MSQLIPLFPLDLVLFPDAPLPLHIFEARYQEMIGECLQNKAPFGVVRAKEEALAEVGCGAQITQVLKRYDDGRLDILTEGTLRFEIIELNQERSFVQANVLFFKDTAEEIASAEQRLKAIALHKSLIELTGSESPAAQETMTAENDRLSFRLAYELPVDLEFKQTLLEMRSEAERLGTLVEYYEKILPTIRHAVRTKEKASTNGHAL
ncbi:MAG TPA: LON peptidase substrate-binding domain-containing protein [Terriglobales bacterium]